MRKTWLFLSVVGKNSNRGPGVVYVKDAVVALVGAS